MKKLAAVGITLVLVAFTFMACGQKAGAPAAGTAKPSDMLAMFPQDATGVMVIDIHRALQTEVAQKMITGQDTAPKYRKFVEETGIDPQKDVYYLAGAMIGDMLKNPEGAVIVNARFNKDALLAKIKKEGGELKQTEYEGIAIYELQPPEKAEPEEMESETPGEGGEEMGQAESTEPQGEMMKPHEKPAYGAFLSDSNFALGTENGIKAVIDVLKNKRENVFKNEALSNLIKEADQKAMFWAAMDIPPEATKKMAESNPMLSTLEGIHSLLLSFDYRDNNLRAEIKILNDDAAKNKQIAEFLTGMKALGGMASGEKPELAELMNKITITSGDNFVSIKADIPEELINRLSEKAKKAMPGMETPEKGPEGGEEY
jgi:hypothetical protein